MNFEDFIGKKIEKCYINKPKDRMVWIVDGQIYQLDAVGDCCSNSWYEHCDNASALQDSTLIEFEDVDQESIDCGGDYIQINMLKFKTNKGSCTIEFRNESNGYYSGWVLFNKKDDCLTLEDYIEKYLKNECYCSQKEDWSFLEDF